MARNPRKARPLVVGSDTFMWSLGHAHQVLEGPLYRDCAKRLAIRRTGARGRLVTAFREGPGRQVPDGYFGPSGAVSAGGQIWLNLHEPGTVRALLDEALAGGWQPDQPSGQARRRLGSLRPGGRPPECAPPSRSPVVAPGGSGLFLLTAAADTGPSRNRGQIPAPTNKITATFQSC
jgi:hypothetical protein